MVEKTIPVTTSADLARAGQKIRSPEFAQLSTQDQYLTYVQDSVNAAELMTDDGQRNTMFANVLNGYLSNSHWNILSTATNLFIVSSSMMKMTGNPEGLFAAVVVVEKGSRLYSAVSSLTNY